jgi:hypothetical protein
MRFRKNIALIPCDCLALNDGDLHRLRVDLYRPTSAEIDTQMVTTNRENKGIDLDLIVTIRSSQVYLNYRLSLFEPPSKFI